MTTQIQTDLFAQVELNDLILKNRIVMAPMTRSRAIGNIPNTLMATYYSQRASAGLIITEGTAPSPNGLGYARIPGIFNAEQIQGWKEVTDAVHKAGGKIIMQLMHVGRVAHPANLPDGAEIVAPSAVKANGQMWTDTRGMQPEPVPRAMTLADIEQAIEEFTQSAKNAIEAGFDGVELHGANGYLLEQFLNEHSNQRTDNYGGNIENRTRFVLEVVQSVSNAIGKEKTGIRLSPYNTFNDMGAYESTFGTYEYLAKELNKLDILYIHLIDYAARSHDEGLRLSKSIRENFNNALILNGGYTKERAIEVLENNEADLIAFGTPFISNPDFPKRIQNDLSLTVPDGNTFYSADAVGYIDYAFHAY